MDAALFAQMLSDKKVTNLKKPGYKYPQADIPEFIGLLKNGFYKSVPLKDFHGNDLVYLDGTTQVHLSAAKILLTPQNSSQLYGTKAMEEEIISTFTIENIDFSRDSVRKIMAGYAPADESENRIFGMKKGLEFISDPANRTQKKRFSSSTRLPQARFCRRRISCCWATITGMIRSMSWARRWSTPASAGRS